MSELKERLLSCLRVDDSVIEEKRVEAASTKLELEKLSEQYNAAVEIRTAFRESTAEKRRKLEEELRIIDDRDRDYTAMINILDDKKYSVQVKHAGTTNLIETLITNKALLAGYSKLCEEFDYDSSSEMLSTVDPDSVVLQMQEGSVPPRLKVTFNTKEFRLVQRGTGLKSHIKYGPLKIVVDWDVQRYGANLRVNATKAANHARAVSDHPHINYSGHVCTGDEAIAISNNLLNGNVASALGLISGCLLFANPSSAYVNLLDVDPLGPWGRIVCPHCNAENRDGSDCEHSSHTTFCANCLQETSVSHCGSCPTCCAKLHTFSLTALDTNSGLNNSGCVLRGVR